jgi:putative spermidine/putrescine transport system substrate-binding protein
MLWLRGVRDGLAEPIDWTIVHKDKVPADAVVADGHGIASNIQGTNLCYRADKFPNGGPKSWADFWDERKFPGNRGLCISDSPRTLIFALLADGVPRDQLYPLDLDRAFKKLDEIKPHIKMWWREGNQSQQLLRDGELDMMSIWNGRATELKQQGVPVELVWDGAVRRPSTWCVLKGAPRRSPGADQFACGASSRPRSTRLYYGPINPDASRTSRLRSPPATYAANMAVSVRGRPWVRRTPS